MSLSTLKRPHKPRHPRSPLRLVVADQILPEHLSLSEFCARGTLTELILTAPLGRNVQLRDRGLGLEG